MRIRFVFILILFCVYHLSAQRGNILPGTYVPGGASVAYSERWQPFHNPSVASLANKIELSCIYENKYIVSELSNKLVSAVVPTKYFNISASFNHFGYSVYNEMLVGLGFSRNFGIWRIGADVDVYMLYLSPTERYAATVTANIGAQVDVTKRITLGFTMFNPVFSAVKSYPQQKLPVVIELGLNYHIHKKVDWLFSLDGEMMTTYHWRTGWEYRPFDVFVVRLGVYGADYVVPTIGVGFKVKDFGFDFHSEINPQLGVTLLGSLHYDI